MKQFSQQFEITLISKLIKGISRVFRKLNYVYSRLIVCTSWFALEQFTICYVIICFIFTKLYFDITISKLLALSTCSLFFSYIWQTAQSFQILLFYHFCLLSAVSSMISNVCMHKLEFNMVVLNSFWLLVLHVTCPSLFISTQFFILNLDSWFDALSNK